MSEERRFNDSRRGVIDEILSERAYQIQRWDAHDRDKDPKDWMSLVVVYAGKAAQELPLYQGPNFSKKRFRKCLVKLAAVCMAAIEALG